MDEIEQLTWREIQLLIIQQAKLKDQELRTKAIYTAQSMRAALSKADDFEQYVQQLMDEAKGVQPSDIEDRFRGW